MEEKALEFLLKYSDWIKDADIFSYIGYKALWWLVKQMYIIASFCEGLIDQIFTLTSFLEDGTIGTIYKSIQILSVTVLAITLIIIAFKFMFNQKVNLKGVFLRSIVFGCLIVQFPSIITQGMDISQKTYNATKGIGDSESTKLSFSMVQDNVADMTYLAKQGFTPLDSSDTTTKKNNLTESIFLNSDLTQVLTPQDVAKLVEGNSEKTEYLQYKIDANKEGILVADKISNGWFSTFDEGKFRYTANFGAIFIGLLTLSSAFIFSAFIIGASILELAFMKILFPVLATSDVETGQRVKHILIDVGKNFLQIMLTGLSLSVFRIYFSFISTRDFNIAVYALACLIGIKVCLDGANALGKYFGVDVGLRSGYKALVGTAMATRAATDGVKALGAGAGALVSGAGTAGQLVKNGAEGARNIGQKSVNGASQLVQSGVKNGAMALGETGGQISEYGVGGFMKEKAKDAKNSVKDGVDNTIQKAKGGAETAKEKVKDGVTQPFKEMKDAYDSGREDGIVKAVDAKSQPRKEMADDTTEGNPTESPNMQGAHLEQPSVSEGTGTPMKEEGNLNVPGQMQVENGVEDAILGDGVASGNELDFSTIGEEHSHPILNSTPNQSNNESNGEAREVSKQPLEKETASPKATGNTPNVTKPVQKENDLGTTKPTLTKSGKPTTGIAPKQANVENNNGIKDLPKKPLEKETAVSKATGNTPNVTKPVQKENDLGTTKPILTKSGKPTTGIAPKQANVENNNGIKDLPKKPLEKETASSKVSENTSNMTKPVQMEGNSNAAEVNMTRGGHTDASGIAPKQANVVKNEGASSAHTVSNVQKNTGQTNSGQKEVIKKTSNTKQEETHFSKANSPRNEFVEIGRKNMEKLKVNTKPSTDQGNSSPHTPKQDSNEINVDLNSIFNRDEAWYDSIFNRNEG